MSEASALWHMTQDRDSWARTAGRITEERDAARAESERLREENGTVWAELHSWHQKDDRQITNHVTDIGDCSRCHEILARIEAAADQPEPGAPRGA